MMKMMMTSVAVLLGLSTPLHAALVASPLVAKGAPGRLQMCATKPAINVERVTLDVQRHLGLELVRSFIAATERGDAAAAMELCTDDFLYKTHSATTESLAAAEKRLHTKVPLPAKVTAPLHEEGGSFVREVVVKPVPFVTVGIRQEFDTRIAKDGTEKLSRAEYIKL
jgi:ketosteroid isomerase-like protein